MAAYRKEFEELAQKEGFNVEILRDAPIYVYENILVDLLWEGFQACIAGVPYNDGPCIESPADADHWRWGWRMAREVGYTASSLTCSNPNRFTINCNMKE